jgi:eukaryotic-like serine/threonine-protein kinase
MSKTIVPEPSTLELGGDTASSPGGTSLGSSGRFRIDDEIGRGGMGRVVEAFDRELGRKVAIKEATADDPATLARFEREIRITALLQHPAIVPLYDAGHTATGAPYYVMRRLAGETLHDRIAACRTLDERLALLPRFLAAADAVGYAHARGVIHRDLKPANILIGEHGESIVIDWGLAKQLAEPEPHTAAAPVAASSPMTAEGAVFGTAGYMAPEQATGRPTDARSDVFALGASLHHILAGALPAGATALPAGVPRDLATIVDKALAREPAGRYADAAGLAQDLRRFLEGRLVAAHRYSLRERAARFVRRHAIAVTAATLAVVVAGVTIGVAAVRVVDERDRARRGEDEARRRQEELVIASAEALLGSDPTRAALVAASLPPASSHWERAREIITDARARGIVRMLPGSTSYIYVLRFDPREQRLLVLDRAGAVILHDLVAHASRVVTRVADAHDIAWIGDSTIAIASQGRIQLVTLDARPVGELATAGRARFAAPDDASFLAWRDDTGAYVRRGSGAAPQRIAQFAASGSLAVSRDGAWIALFGGHEPLRLARGDGTAVALPRELVADQAVFDDAGRRLAASVGDASVVELDLTGPVPAERSTWAVGDPGLLAYAGRTLFVTTMHREVIVLAKDYSPIVAALTARPSHSMVAIANDVVAVTAGDNTVTVVDGMGTVLALHAPSERLYPLTASPSHRALVAGGSDGSVVAWQVPDVVATPLPDAQQSLTLVRSEGLILCNELMCTRTRFGTTQAFAFGTFPAEVVPPYTWLAPNEATAIMGDLTGHLTAARFSDGVLEPFGDAHVRALAFAGSDAVACLVDGSVEVRYPFAHHAVRPLATLPAKGLAIAATERVVAVALADGTLWRHDLQRGSSELARAGASPTGALAIAPDGDVIAGVGTRLVRWHGDRVSAVASFGAPVDEIEIDPGVGITALTHDRVVHHIAPSGVVRSTVVPPGGPPALARRGAIALVLDPTGTVVRIDAVTGTTRTLGPPGATSFGVGFTGNIAVQRTNGITIYRDDLPHSPDELVRWVRDATNGELDRDVATIRWR